MNQEIVRLDLGGVNAYLIKQEESCILVDTGGYITTDKTFNSRRELLLQQLAASDCNTENLKLVVLTHGDCDHAANAAFMRSEFGVKIAMHSADVGLVDHPTLEKMMESFHYRSVFLKVVFALIKGKIDRIMKKTQENFEGFQPDILVAEGDDLAPYGVDACIIGLPGHTKGSIGILTARSGLISGDIIANTGKPAAAPNAYDFKVLDESIQRIKAMNPQTVFPGHGKPFEMKNCAL